MDAPSPGTRLSELDTPAVLVDLDRLDGNLAGMAKAARDAGVRLRPHTKTHKSAWIAAEQLRHGASGLTVAKLGEAEVMADAGQRDILIAYPVVGHTKLDRLAALAARVRISVATDDPAVADGLAAVGRGLSEPLAVYVEVDTGHHRCGRAPGADSAVVAEHVAAREGLRLAGLMTHAGHSYAAATSEERRAIALDEARGLVETAQLLERRGITGLRLSVGSTPTAVHIAEVAREFPSIGEMRPGNYAFNDAMQLTSGVATEERCALTVLATIVSRPAPDRAIADAGSKTLGADGAGVRGTGFGRILGEPRATVHALSEEHAWMTIGPGFAWGIGDRVRIVPNHACVVPNLAGLLVGVRGDHVERAIAVDARGMAR